MAVLIASHSRRLVRSLLALACLSAGEVLEAAAQATPGELERQVKAAYLLNFTRYVEWPPSTFAGPDDPVTLCVVAPQGFDEVVRNTVAGRRSHERTVRVLVPDTPAQLKACHLAYLAPARGRVGPWLAALRGHHTLTVGDGPGFLSRGGMVGFVAVEQTVRFEVSQTVVHDAGLEISSRVLALATRVQGE